MTNDRPNLVPASVQRVRCFLQTRGRMKVKPWAPPEEVLDALYATLASCHADDEFWSELQALLDTLCRDATRRLTAQSHELIDNEILAPDRYEELIGEIRQGLGASRHPGGRGGFRDLARSLSGPGAALLVMLGGATTVSCSASHDVPGDAATDSAADSRVPDAALLDTALPDTRVPDTALSDTGPTCAAVADVAACVPPALRSEVCACVDVLNASWDSALRDLVDRVGCRALDSYVYCMLNKCADPATAGDFDIDMFLSNCSTPLYLGVRFE